MFFKDLIVSIDHKDLDGGMMIPIDLPMTKIAVFHSDSCGDSLDFDHRDSTCFEMLKTLCFLWSFVTG